MTETEVTHIIELKKGNARLTLLPERGGAIGSWQSDQREIFYPCENENLTAQKGALIAGYPLFPYSNRIDQGRFSFGHRDYQLSPNMAGCPHPIHGNSWENPWKLSHKTDSHAILTFDFKPDNNEKSDPRWPFAYRATLVYQLFEKKLEISLVIENRDQADQPVGFGFHPFIKCDPASTLSFKADNLWLMTEDGLPLELIENKDEWSFSKPNHFYERDFDHVYSGWEGDIILNRGDNNPSVRVKADPVFSHLVIFSPKESDFVAIEPVTMMTDAINHPEIVERGLHVLSPGKRMGGTISFEILENVQTSRRKKTI
ncbi:aldose 1-epimerase [Aristophania vespae]|uniref:aldose 1-epimerase n=1 Tax=Aristophania vespae TaxID=2697033 RepID=UPI002351120A|nr:aldose 1-epimerase [Aristophania vespae]UMM64636.1 putative protein YphB [Aristophania vespae]